MASRTPSRQTQRLLAYGLLAAFDSMATISGFLLASVVRFGEPFSPTALQIGGITLIIYLGVALNGAAYSIAALEQRKIALPRVTWALVFALAVSALAAFFFKTAADFSRLVVGIGAATSLAALWLARLAAHRIVRRLLGSQLIDQLLIVDGCPRPAGPLLPTVVAEQEQLVPSLDDPWMLDRLARLLHGRDRVIVCCRPEHRHDWAFLLKGANINGFLLLDELEVIGAVGLPHYGAFPLIQVASGPLDLRSRAMKRLLDVTGAAVALVFLLPFMLIVALAIRLDSPGPVFFRQQRVGRGNKLFSIYKFRSMFTHQSDLAGAASAARRDPRVTRVGAILRKSSIDELPQLLNVLLGDMSFVGPRPHALGSTAEDQLFWQVDRRYWLRHAIKPGITGLAQVRGFRGATHARSDLEARLQSDLEYLSGWTIGRDLVILLLTVRVLVHSNAF